LAELDPSLLHVRYVDDELVRDFSLPRRYTLTHSDRTGDRFLTIGREHDREQISGRYTRFMRDEVLAEWKETDGGYELHVHMHVCGGLVFGNASMRYWIFQKCLRSVLQALRLGDEPMFHANPEMDRSPVRLHFNASRRKYDRLEDGGQIGEYRADIDEKTA